MSLLRFAQGPARMLRNVRPTAQITRPAVLPRFIVSPAASAFHTSAKRMQAAESQTLITPSAESLGFEVTGVKTVDNTRPIYMDMQATSPTDPRVLDAMLPYMTELYGNPHSRTHSYGWESEKGVDQAREDIAKLIGADAKEIVFTSGATESNNLSIKGVARFYKGKKNHIITTQTEHKCVLDSCRVLSDEGFEVTYLPVAKNGLISMDDLKAAIRPDTALVSIMAVNNEIGVIQPLEEIGALCRSKKIFFHTDAAQAIGKIPIDVTKMNIDLLSISGHKIYGPKGVGALYVRRRPRVRLVPLLTGGGQERGLRSGTVAAPLAVGLGEACRIATVEMAYDHERVKQLSERLINGIQSKVTHVYRNGDEVQSYPGCVNLSFAYEPSDARRALGAEYDMAHSSIRFGIGRFTTEEEIDFVVSRVVAHVDKLREMSPLWEMVQEGIDISKIEWAQHA
ncbi:cysteine desulfurase [Linnemannia exigua]|uniref:Cysteine desulfurase, mitosomal n=1 Tax=Linnemannia exigua TaxID=604196 RepID=A0AAD4DEW3_9FUNG|nr:cysteine desulfurase [Linnemannia exigua]